MSKFSYIGVNRKGDRLEGMLESFSMEQASAEIRQMGINPISITPIKSKKRIKLSEIELTKPKVDLYIKVVFFRELATLLNAGIQLVDSLEILQMVIKDKTFARALIIITNRVRSGHRFSEALNRYPEIFPGIVVSMVKAAEIGGGLGNILDKIALYVEKEESIRKKIKSATGYPKFIFTFSFLIIFAVIFGLLPKFEDIYATFDAELPGPTLVIVHISHFMVNNIVLEIAAVILMVIMYKLFEKSAEGRELIDRYSLSLPVIGPLLHQAMIVRVTQTLSILLNNGVTLINSLRIASETSGNVYVTKVFNDIRNQISTGKTLASQLSLYPDIFTTLVASMIGVGEKSGALALMLDKVAQFTDEDFNNRIDRISDILQPILMGGMGAVICIIILVLYLPIFQMTGAMK